MDEQKLRSLIEQHEADRVELTVSTDDTDKFSEAVCAFANDLAGHQKPGYLIVGVTNAGKLSGLTVTDQLLRNLGGLRDDGNIQPLPSLKVEKVVTSDGEVAVVTVQPSLLPPVRYRGRVCIRIGPRRGYATEQEERTLIERRVSSARTFDAEPCLGASLDDLDRRLFLIDYVTQAIAPDVVAENHRPLEQQLASLRFFDQRRACPTNAGVILFGRDVLRWLPGAYVQFLQVNGTSLVSPIGDDHRLSGDLLTVLRKLEALIEANLTLGIVRGGVLTDLGVQNYPEVAVRELLMNAVLHRDYGSTAPLRVTWFEDRIEIQSPGGLYGEVSRENFPTQTSYRNPVIAEAMYHLGYVNRYGRGVVRAQAALAANGNRPADFQFDRGFVLVTLWAHT